DIMPMWIGDEIFFISDRDHTMNLFVYNTKTQKTEKLTNYTDYDVKFPSTNGKLIVYEQGGYIFRFDPATRQSVKIDIQMNAEGNYARTEHKDVSKNVTAFSISEKGNRVAVTARGEVFNVPVYEGVTKNLTRTPGANERSGSISPDGKYIAYISDKTGETEVYLLTLETNEVKQLTRNSDTYIRSLFWSPDSKTLIYTDRKNRMVSLGIPGGASKLLMQSPESEFRSVAFSPDSKWITYTRPAKNTMSVVYVYNLQTGKEIAVTEKWYDSSSPIFSSDGKYLIYSASRDFSPTYGQLEWNYTYALVLETVDGRAQFGRHAVVEQVGEVGGAVEEPESGGFAIGHHIAVADGIALRNLLRADIDGCQGAGGGVVDAEPVEGADLVGQPAAGLGDEPKARLLRTGGTLELIFLAVHFEAHRAPAVGAAEFTGADIFREVEGRALEVVALGVGDIFHRQFFLGTDGQRHLVGRVVAGGEVEVAVSVEVLAAEDAEGRPGAGFAAAEGVVAGRGVGVAEAEVLILAGEEAHLPGEADHVGRIDAVVGIVEREMVDAAAVGVGRDFSVGDADGHPDRAFLFAFADDFHDPGLFRVGDRERLAFGGVAVFGQQVADRGDGFPGGAGALEREVDQRAVVDQAVGIGQPFAAAEGGLADDELVFIDVAGHLERMRNLRDAAQVAAAVPVVNIGHCAGRPVGGGPVIELSVELVGVGQVTDHAGAVGGGALGYDDVGAGRRLDGRSQQADGDQGEEERTFHRGLDLSYKFKKNKD
ncbi:MAG: PD40 domain-containing protein, partial [Bacteroidales bacterium]|nr:PD40 domain-containing protein [Bacteroidales bacterium]